MGLLVNKSTGLSSFVTGGMSGDVRSEHNTGKATGRGDTGGGGYVNTMTGRQGEKPNNERGVHAWGKDERGKRRRGRMGKAKTQKLKLGNSVRVILFRTSIEDMCRVLF
jgi:hypothetical protein